MTPDTPGFRFSINYYFDALVGKECIRANIWTPEGAGSKTCYSASEAQSWINTKRNQQNG